SEAFLCPVDKRTYGEAFVVVGTDVAQNRRGEHKRFRREEEKSGTFTFKVPVDVVVVNLVVTDKQGNPVKDLTFDDFRLYEEGQPQRIHTLALESYKSTETEARQQKPQQAKQSRGRLNVG